MNSLCISCGKHLEEQKDIEDTDLLRALKDASRTEKHYHAYNLHDLVSEDNLAMPLCALCCISALSVMNRELYELDNENVIYECNLKDLLEDRQSNPYNSDLVQDKLRTLTIQEQILENELVRLAYEEEALAREIHNQKLMKEELMETAEELTRNVKQGKRTLLGHLEKLHYYDSQTRFYADAIELLKLNNLTRLINEKIPDPVYLNKIGDDELD
uniref:Uncharacterized protein n=1 Tax=Panagrolaimus sp. JU765 TaxID=591449 RepID=A0AC34R197_9BILA